MGRLFGCPLFLPDSPLERRQPMRLEFASINSELAPADDLAGACFSTLRFMPERIRWQLHKAGLWEDLVQEIYLTAWQAYREGLDRHEASRLMGRKIYAFLKAYGYRPYRKSCIRMEVSFGEVYPWEVSDRGIPASCETPRPFAGKDGLGDRILEILQRRPEGLTKRNLATWLGISVDEVSSQVAPLIKSSKIVAVERENWKGRPLTPLLFSAGAQLPAQTNTRAEARSRILHDYFVEGKAIKRIAKDYGHCHKVVGRLVREAKAAGWQSPSSMEEVAVH